MSVIINSQLNVLIKKKQLPHAILVEGLSEEKVTELINYIIRAFLCENKTNTPCEECINCIKCKGFIHPDVEFVKKSGTLKSFSVDTIRQVRESAYVLPNEAKYKIYVLNGADDMSQGAQNALLKILEEPPKGVAFILGVRTASSLLSTIRSRVTVFSLYDDLFLCDDAQVMDLTKKMLDAVLSLKEFDVIKCSSILIRNKQLFKNVMLAMEIELREAYIDICVNEKIVTKWGRNLTVSQIVDMIDCINESIKLLEKNVNQTLTVTNLFFKLRDVVFC